MPSNTITTPTPCPVLLTAKAAAKKAADLTMALRQIRNLLNTCSTCQTAATCTALDYYNNAIDDAVRTIAAEYGLTQ